MLNKVILIGNLGKDPEVRSLPSGQPVATWTMANGMRALRPRPQLRQAMWARQAVATQPIC